MRSLSEVLLDRKREKFSGKLQEAAARWMAEDPFRDFLHKPSAEQAVEMMLAARSGPGDPLSCGGDLFTLEYVLDELDLAVATGKERQLEGKAVLMDPDGHTVRICTSQSESWANLVFVFDVDESIYSHWTRMGLADFDVVMREDGVISHAVEKESRAFGFTLSYEPMVPVGEIPKRLDENAIRGGTRFEPHFNPWPTKANDKCTIYWVTVGPLDRLLSETERHRHDVIGFERKLASGGTTSVRPHERRNPRRLASRRENLDEVAHVVYRAYDADGVLRYVGEGRSERPEHVNSGTSHNFKLNEHFFRRGPMRVEIVARGLSKDEGLTVERLLIRGHRGPGELWNIKDYERPLADREQDG
jgi:hypothetical protein